MFVLDAPTLIVYHLNREKIPFPGVKALAARQAFDDGGKTLREFVTLKIKFALFSRVRIEERWITLLRASLKPASEAMQAEDNVHGVTAGWLVTLTSLLVHNGFRMQMG